MERRDLATCQLSWMEEIFIIYIDQDSVNLMVYYSGEGYVEVVIGIMMELT